jgi:hypothetical protein
MAAVVLCILCTGILTAGAALPKKGFIAVLVTGPPPYLTTVDTIVTNRLISSGRKVADKATLERIRRDKAARLALEGDADAILKLSSKYGYSVLVKVEIADLRAMRDDFGFFKGSAVLNVTAIASDASIIFADTFTKTKPGRTRREVESAALETAAGTAAEKMTE